MSKIRIHSGVFLISDPFVEGHLLTQREADALNGLRAENIRNNLAKEYARLPKPLTEEALEGFAQRVAKYDAEYQFYGSIVAKSPRSRGAFEEEVEKVARERAEDEGDYTELMTDPEVQAEARRRLEMQRQVAQKAAEELGLGDKP